MNHSFDKITFLVKASDHGKTVYRFLKEQGVSYTLVRKLKKVGLIHRNGKPTFMEICLQEGDHIDLLLPYEESESLLPEAMDLDVLHEDEDLLIINKSSGIPVHPTYNFSSGTLANGVIHYWQKKSKQYRFRPINRLDKDTSGIVVIALHAFAQHFISEQQKKHQFYKEYIALVHGCMNDDAGLIDAPIGRKEGSIIEREVREDGHYALTRYSVIQRFQEVTLVRIQLLTGRTHQIRVHFSHIGHPLLGDDLYGGSRVIIARQALHAHKISFRHPRTGEPFEVVAPYPDDLNQAIQYLTNGG